MKNIIYFSKDSEFLETIGAIITFEKIIQRDLLKLRKNDPSHLKLIFIDGDLFKHQEIMTFLTRHHNSFTPFIILHSNCNGKETMELIKKGASTVIFKNSKRNIIEKEIIDVLMNYRYLNNVKQSSVNEKILTSFLKIINTINSNDDIDKSMHKILEAIDEFFSFKSLSFFICSDKKFVKKIVLPERTTSRLKHIQTMLNKKEFYNLILNSPLLTYTDNFPELLNSGLSKNTLLLPIKSNKKILGVIIAQFKKSNETFSENKKKILSIFVNYTSVILENAKLYWDIIKTQEKLIQEEKKSLLNQMIISLNHEINNPLSIISMQAQLLQKKSSSTNSNLDQRLDKIELNIDRIKSILEKISNLNMESENFIEEYSDGKKMINITNEN